MVSELKKLTFGFVFIATLSFLSACKSKNVSGESDLLIEFLEQAELEEGNIYENDVITKSIESILKSIKLDKENILVIDDLDRIDPEHIFIDSKIK